MYQQRTTYKGMPVKVVSESKEVLQYHLNHLDELVTRDRPMYEAVAADTTGTYTEEEKKVAQNWLIKFTA